MCTFLSDVRAAIQRIDRGYFLWKNTPDENLYTMLERVFCYEFYHQFRKIMEQDKKYDGLVFNAEIRKDIVEEYSRKKYKYPDFVLHGGQNCLTRQELVIEVKTKDGLNKKNLKEDIEKLCYFTSNIKDHWLGHFNAGVFIVVNMLEDELKEEISKISKEIRCENLEKIHCIGASSYDFFSLAELAKDRALQFQSIR